MVVGGLCEACIALFLPPLAVLLRRGCGLDLLVNIALCFVGWIPAILHAWFVILHYPTHRQKRKLERERRRREAAAAAAAADEDDEIYRDPRHRHRHHHHRRPYRNRSPSPRSIESAESAYYDLPPTLPPVRGSREVEDMPRMRYADGPAAVYKRKASFAPDVKRMY